MVGTVDGKRVAVGNAALFAALGIEPGDLPARADALRQEGQGVMLIAVDGKRRRARRRRRSDQGERDRRA